MAFLVAAGFHGVRHLQKQQAMSALPSVSGQPDGLMLLPGPPGGARAFEPILGARIDAQQLARFVAQERAKGFEVEELPGGVLRIRPPKAGHAGGSP